MNDILSTVFASAMLLLPACRTVQTPAPAAAMSARAPYYRFFLGAMRQDLSREQYLLQLSTSFVPALSTAYADKGASAHIVALPPDSKPAWVADEFALIAWESEDAYKAALKTPQGRRHVALRWTVFDFERSRSGPAVLLAGALLAETPYDILQKPVDWQTGYASFYVGLRKAGVSPEEFLKKMREHVQVVGETLAPLGLDGYVMVAGADYEAAYLHWPSRQAAEAAFASEASRPATETGRAILDDLMFTPVEPFAGTIKPGQAVNVRFKRRSPK